MSSQVRRTGLVFCLCLQIGWLSVSSLSADDQAEINGHVSVEYVDGSPGAFTLKPHSVIKPDATRMAFVLTADEPTKAVRVTVSSGQFPIVDGAWYSIARTNGHPLKYLTPAGATEVVFELENAANCSLLVEPLSGSQNQAWWGSFEEGPQGATPSHWTLTTYPHSWYTLGFGNELNAGGIPSIPASSAISATMMYDDTYIHDGNFSLKITKTGDGGQVMVRQALPVPVTPGKSYIVSGFYRCEAPVFGGVVELVMSVTQNGSYERWLWNPQTLVPSVKSGGEWRQISFRCTVPAGYNKTQALLVLRGPAQTIWLDGLEIREAPTSISSDAKYMTTSQIAPVWSVGEVQSYWAARSAPTVEVRSVSSVVDSASITFAGQDTTTLADWRNAAVPKNAVFDPNGDQIYGSDGYYMLMNSDPVGNGNATPYLRSHLPAFVASAAPAVGISQWGSKWFAPINDPEGSLAGVYGGKFEKYVVAGAEQDFLTITLARDATFVMGVIAGIDNVYLTDNLNRVRVRQTVGGSADSGLQNVTAAVRAAHYYFFKISGKQGDQFVISGTAPNDGYVNITGLSFESVHGRPVLMVDDQPTPWLFNNPGGHRGSSDDSPLFYDAGMRVVLVPVVMGFPTSSLPQCWTGLNTYDFSYVQSAIEAQLQRTPNAKVILYASISPWFKEFGDNYSNAVWTDGQGRKVGVKTWHSTIYYDSIPDDAVWVPSYTAEDFRREVSSALTALANNLNTFSAGKAVIGLHMIGGNDGQWFPPVSTRGFDYSPGAQASFREYLTSLYGTNAALQVAWNDPYVTLATATLAIDAERATSDLFLDPQNGHQRKVIDSNRFASVGLAQTLERFAATFKSALGRNVLVSTYYPDIFAGSNGQFGLEEIEKHCPDIDGVVSVMPYGWWRIPGSASAYNSVAGSLALHNKFMLNELDYRDPLGWMGGDAWFDNMVSYGGVTTEDALMSQARRDWGMMFCQGQGGWYMGIIGPAWTWNSSSTTANLTELLRAADLAAQRPRSDHHGQVAVICDERMVDCSSYQSMSSNFTFGMALNSTAIGLTRQALSRSGVTWDAYLTSDLGAQALLDYKAYVFLSPTGMTQQQIAWVQNNLQKDGRILLWVGPAGISSDGGGFASNMQSLTGMSVSYTSSDLRLYRIWPAGSLDTFLREPLRNNAITEMAMPLIEVTDGNAVTLGLLSDSSNQVGLALRRFTTPAAWTSVVATMPGGLTPELLRNLVEEVGLTPVGPLNDVTYAGNGFLVIHATSAGDKTLHWSTPSDVLDLTSNAVIASGVTSLTVSMDATQTRWFHLTPVEP